MEAVRSRARDLTISPCCSEGAPTPRERFEARAEKIALLAAQLPQARLRRENIDSDPYDSTPFGLRRRLPPRHLAVGQEHDRDRIASIAKREDSACPDPLLAVKRACLDAARDLLLEMVMVDAELSRSAGGDGSLVVAPAKAYSRPAGSEKTMSRGSERSFSRRREYSLE
jgi:hypothetical protein